MKKVVLAAFLVLSVLGSADAAGRATQVRRFVLGIELLNAQRNLNDGQRAAFYRKLQQLTGVTAEEAVRYVETYRDRPEAWKKQLDAMKRQSEKLAAKQQTTGHPGGEGEKTEVSPPQRSASAERGGQRSEDSLPGRLPARTRLGGGR